MSKSYSIESLNELAGGDEDFMGILAQTFLNEIPRTSQLWKRR
ncbi:hypothetical protein [Aureitalea marina]|nr:hypothetical protein [Aureitalea marina]